MVLVGSCTENNNHSKQNPGVSNDTVSSVRKITSKKPVAKYVIPMGDPKLDRKFGVEIFETDETFKYLLVMYHDGTLQNDTLNIPNFGIVPTIKIKPGKEKLSCIIGFFDTKNEFREYKLLAVKNDILSLTTLKKYAVATYSK